jgi:hypothetical protein
MPYKPGPLPDPKTQTLTQAIDAAVTARANLRNTMDLDPDVISQGLDRLDWCSMSDYASRIHKYHQETPMENIYTLLVSAEKESVDAQVSIKSLTERQQNARDEWANSSAEVQACPLSAEQRKVAIDFVNKAVGSAPDRISTLKVGENVHANLSKKGPITPHQAGMFKAGIQCLQEDLHRMCDKKINFDIVKDAISHVDPIILAGETVTDEQKVELFLETATKQYPNAFIATPGAEQ